MHIWLDGRIATTANPDKLSLHKRLEQSEFLLLKGDNSDALNILSMNTERQTPKTLTIRSENGNNKLIHFTSDRDGEKVIGAFVLNKTSADLDQAMALLGSVTWLLVEIADRSCWKMIPVENLVAYARLSGTKLAVCVQHEEDVLGLARSLELGVDALCVAMDASEELWQSVVQAQKERNNDSTKQSNNDTGVTQLAATGPQIVAARCCKLAKSDFSKRGGTGGTAISVLADRVCIDFVQLLKPSEGCWIGSSAKTMALVLSEASPSEFVPSRPFRVNAGPVHSYVVMADGKTTKYLCELQAGDEMLVFDCQTNNSRAVAVGRLKVELRPCVVVGLETTAVTTSIAQDGALDETNDKNKDETTSIRFDAHVLLQQAETVRLGTQEGSFVSMMDLPTRAHQFSFLNNNWDGEVKDAPRILLRVMDRGTHIGQAYPGKVQET